MKHNLYLMTLIMFLTLPVLFSGCSNPESNSQNDYLIKVGKRIATVLDFQKAFEATRVVYPHNMSQKSAAHKEAQIRLLKQMTEELILLERAKELNISVTDEEIKKAVAEIKADYPDEVFEETLLEYAVSYEAWEKALKTRILMEKLVAKELKDQIEITPDDISEYYKEHYKNGQLAPEMAMNSNDINEKIVEHLRRQKTEAAYKLWIEKIQKKYEIEINKEQWEKIISS